MSKKMTRKSPPLFPMAFHFSESDEIIIVDFACSTVIEEEEEEDNNNYSSFSSVALTKKTALALKTRLDEFLIESDK